MSRSAGTLAAAIAALAVAAPSLAAPLSVHPPFPTKKEAENLSGAACAPTPARVCLLVSDEMRFARTFEVSDQAVELGAPVALLPEAEGDETDAEGVAYWNDHYYLAGSHGMSKGGELQASRFFVYALPVAADGTAQPPASRTDRLRAILRATPPFDAHAEKPLAEGGVNIEGIAVRDGVAYFAFRGPVLNDRAQVLKVSLDALFAAKASDAEALAIPTGPGVGLRDIAAVDGGFLLLTGPEADIGGPADVRFWDGGTQGAGPPVAVPHAAKAKPEALLVVSQAGETYDLLILSDGVAGGEPTLMQVRKAELRPHR